ncbi:GNAT family N-acetyltransferase [Bacillus luteolus]|uniref:GNAT family N-acetyltransferase n=1 Tax=Litchfieldia luteola TaxID=682179 RepID=A0ABR9QFF7_9BACI|nr:GNAT family N-acetyltransferase [Cytobacillus luteolus]MBE4907220.1 GNAT family N-acetyltransferase [Cytobacillus luteolus]MBP1943304.1 CelD/BcsL family acetyltransferase involved in cellulose biosynthesis [Cytobacillus luteolus]
MEVLIHKEIDTLELIIPVWKTLREEFHEITVFQDINWIKSWWVYKSSQSNIIPYIIEIKDKNHTVGIIPLYCSTIRFVLMDFRVLKPIGSEISDYLIPILSKNYSHEVLLKLALDKLYEDKNSWDYIEWVDVPGDSLFAKFLNGQPPISKYVSSYRTVVCPFLRLSENIEEVKNQFNKNFLKGILYNIRRISRNGILQYSKVKTEEEIEPMLNTFFVLHCKRWENTSTPSRFRNKEDREQIIQAAKTLFYSNLLYLAYLSYNDEIIVVHFGMTDGQKNYLYLHAINNIYRHFSPGNIFVYNLILDACKDGYEIVDFLRGDEDYKQKWGTINRYNFTYIITNQSIKSFLFRKGYQLIHLESNWSNNLKHLIKRLNLRSVQ